ncbi:MULTISPECIES: DUF262 domain-containing protein [Corallococcus]|uniref:DUF262 domain-containing protein n=1 Tax=Corallococcus TaxID=83461 RepID=UPI00148E5244|nr:DUF262 domain-containing protein [Corallococcus carmarthensis]NOK20776.1 DUF262 domain-containing protein [Corallococcus carmarthensis]
MSKFRLSSMHNSAVLYVYAMRESIWTDPPYQRQSDIWSIQKRQLLIDSIINGYDIPKFYFHEFNKPKSVGGKQYDYAVIDGKQRIQSIFEFINGTFALSSEIEYIHDSTIDLRELSYKELAQRHPMIKIKFDSFTLPIVTVQTSDSDFIEEMFSRLNEAIPLNAAEKRNAWTGPIPPISRQQAQLTFFTNKLPFKNTRYRHYELATKFLYIEHKGKLTDTKKAYLDDFVRSFKPVDQPTANILAVKSEKVLWSMASVFTDEDPLLRSVGMIVVYYYLFHEAQEEGWTSDISRKALLDFEDARIKNREIAEHGEVKADYTLLEFDRFSQSPNDSVALQYRYAVMRRYVGPVNGRPPIPGNEP